jgi:glyoxylase-like metal-dependent hydrolase (beta-lactamase superfamily II)
MGGLDGVTKAALVFKGRSVRSEPEEGLLPHVPSTTGETQYVDNTDLVQPLAYRCSRQVDLVFPTPAHLNYTEISDGTAGRVEGAYSVIGGAAQSAMLPSHLEARAKQRMLASPAALTWFAMQNVAAVEVGAPTTIDGRPHATLEITTAAGLFRLLVDPETHLPARAETSEADPVYGDVTYAVRFGNWKSVGRWRVPFALTHTVGDVTVEQDTRDSVDPSVAPAISLAPAPAAADPAQVEFGDSHSEWLIRMLAVGYPSFTDQTRVTFTMLAPGVFHVTGGSHHSLVVEQDKSLVVIEAPLHEERSQAVLAAIGQRFANKAISRVVATHFHVDHAGGVRAYLAKGAELLVGADARAYFDEIAHAPHELSPDALAQRGGSPRVVMPVNTKQVLADATHAVEIYPITTTHARGMLVAYLPHEKILFESDLWSPSGSIVLAPLAGGSGLAARELAQAIAQLGLDVAQIAGGHGGVGTLADLRVAAGMDAPPKVGCHTSGPMAACPPGSDKQ